MAEGVLRDLDDTRQGLPALPPRDYATEPGRRCVDLGLLLVRRVGD
jgi:hypothetical protein